MLHISWNLTAPMAGPKYIWHVTLNTGHCGAQPRSAVGDDAIAAVRPMIAADGTHPLPVPGGDYSLVVTRLGSNLAATVMHLRLGPLATIAVARKSQTAGRLWRELHATVPNAAAHVADLPRAPWCAVALHPALNVDLAATSWLGDFERCLAWAWIERLAPKL